MLLFDSPINDGGDESSRVNTDPTSVVGSDSKKKRGHSADQRKPLIMNYVWILDFVHIILHRRVGMILFIKYLILDTELNEEC